MFKIIQILQYNTKLLGLDADGEVWEWNPNINDWVEFKND